jgi:hypothetical protein
MTSAADDLIPENYYRWPRAVQRRYIEQLYALYFPGRTQMTAGQAAITAATPQPGDGDIVEAEIVEP